MIAVTLGKLVAYTVCGDYQLLENLFGSYCGECFGLVSNNSDIKLGMP